MCASKEEMQHPLVPLSPYMAIPFHDCIRSGFCSSLDSFPSLLTPCQLPLKHASMHKLPVDTAQGTLTLHTHPGVPVLHPLVYTHDQVYTSYVALQKTSTKGLEKRLSELLV